MSKKPVKVLEATQDALYAVQFVRQFGNQIKTQLGVPNRNEYVPGGRSPIVCNLLQPVSNGEQALAVVLESTDTVNSFRADMLGYFNQEIDFQFKLKVEQRGYTTSGNVASTPVTTLAISSLIYSRQATAQVIQDALVAGGMDAKSVAVSIGNRFQSESLVNNQALRRQTSSFTPATPVNQLYSYTGCFYVSFPNHQDYALTLTPLEADGGTFQPNQLKTVVTRRTTLLPTDYMEYVRDIFMVPAHGPLVAGTQVACSDFSGIGYGIVSAGPREFFAN